MTEIIIENLTPTLSFLTLLSHPAIIILALVLFAPSLFGKVGKNLGNLITNWADILILCVSFVSIIGSMLYSNVIGFEACSLCWWERMFIYPLAIMILVAIIKKQTSLIMPYILWVSVPGLILSAYHTYLQLGGKAIAVCGSTGVDCAKTYFLEYGYITIPTMALTAYVLIFVLTLSVIKRDSAK